MIPIYVISIRTACPVERSKGVLMEVVRQTIKNPRVTVTRLENGRVRLAIEDDTTNYTAYMDMTDSDAWELGKLLIDMTRPK